jgi:hypothetical protein
MSDYTQRKIEDMCHAMSANVAKDMYERALKCGVSENEPAMKALVAQSTLARPWRGAAGSAPVSTPWRIQDSTLHAIADLIQAAEPPCAGADDDDSPSPPGSPEETPKTARAIGRSMEDHVAVIEDRLTREIRIVNSFHCNRLDCRVLLLGPTYQYPKIMSLPRVDRYINEADLDTDGRSRVEIAYSNGLDDVQYATQYIKRVLGDAPIVYERIITAAPVK